MLEDLHPAVLPILLGILIGLPLLTGLLANRAARRLERMCTATEAAGGVAATAAGEARSYTSVCCVCGAYAPAHCKGCSTREYCGVACQRKDWNAGHRQQCKKLRAAQQSRRAAAAQHGTACAEAQPGAPDAASSSSSSSPAHGTASSAPPAESNTTPPVPRRVIYPYDRFLELLERPPSRRAPTGLANSGNTCFANSLLQPLLATPPLAAFLLSGEHGGSCTRRASKEFCLLCDLEDLTQQAYSAGSGSSGRSAVLNPRQMLRNIKRIGKQFTYGTQEDSHELYVQILDWIDAAQLAAAGGKARFDLRSRETTLVHHIFGCYMRSEVACLACGHVSKSYDPQLGLVLELHGGAYRAGSVEEALRHHTARERLDGANKYKCDKCNSYVAADKRNVLEVAPNILQVTLKRYTVGRFVGKLRSHVSFSETLDLGPYLAEDCLDEQPAQYSLFGVVVHQGSMASWGHYVSYVRVGCKWYNCNDESVTPVAAHQVLKDNPYMLFYQREVPRQLPAGPRSAPPTPRKAEAAAAAASLGPAAAWEEAEPAAATVLGRIQTAPAALTHLPEASSAAAAAACAAGAQAPEQQADSSAASRAPSPVREEDVGEPPAALPQRFHPSVSESNLQQRATTSAGAGEKGPPAGQEQPGTAAARDAGGAAASGGSSGDSDGEESEDEGPAAVTNPYELLASSGGEEEGGEPVVEAEPHQPQDAQLAPEAASTGPATAGAAGAAAGGDRERGKSTEQAGSSEPGGCSHLPNGTAEPATSSAAGSSASGCAADTGPQASAQPGSQRCNGHCGEHGAPDGMHGSKDSGSGGGGWVPEYRLEQKQLDDGSDVIRLSVDLPGVSADSIDLRVSEDCRQLWLGAEPGVSTTLALPAPVEPVQRRVKFIANKQRLVALFNVMPA